MCTPVGYENTVNMQCTFIAVGVPIVGAASLSGPIPSSAPAIPIVNERIVR
jgi:hypothetical protein